MENKHTSFPGTYFNKDSILKLASVGKIFSWIVAGFYALQWLFQAISLVSQLIQGFWAGLGFIDIFQNILGLFEQPLRGLVYFIVLQGVSQALLMFMDMEDNTRRAARKSNDNL
jgi:hypothetical protein